MPITATTTNGGANITFPPCTAAVATLTTTRGFQGYYNSNNNKQYYYLYLNLNVEVFVIKTATTTMNNDNNNLKNDTIVEGMMIGLVDLRGTRGNNNQNAPKNTNTTTAMFQFYLLTCN